MPLHDVIHSAVVALLTPHRQPIAPPIACRLCPPLQEASLLSLISVGSGLSDGWRSASYGALAVAGGSICHVHWQTARFL